MTVDFYFDPGCPWTWMTSRWAVEAAAARGVEIQWRTYSLKVKNADNPNLPEVYRERQQAQFGALRVIEATRADLGLDDDDVLVEDLVGCRAVLRDGTPWGEVVGLELGPQVRLVIHHAGVERLLPLVDALVPTIDLPSKTITVDPPDGLPEEPIAP